MWCFESQQWRMGKSFFDDKKGYLMNSPIEHARKIITPLLSWSGKEDLWINWNQSVEFYLALRRLGKKNIMLLYPKEGHSLSSPKNLIDLSVRFHEWFDHHLQGTPAADWINKGLK
jgi:dipeptidyl aminopeptidase/acylaminoacyl peptidase